ncbi:MAG: SUMF1/EgtB/PvdO family nonheme iron enzyme [Acidobacteria bacterium]|jgi:formylglycine-generating enzyme required for sulfatase activity|nr:SUMF1/EgtB/PvdO family nonheme iron enzyme [Acidobacteriota bacterium]
MKKTTVMISLALLSAIFLGAETIANVTGQKGLVLTIDRGAADGVETGMKGIVKAVYKEPGGEYTINIGIFTVRRVAERTAEATIEIGRGLNPADARYVVFEKELLPLPGQPATDDRGADWHLEQGDKAAEAGDAKTALEHYQQALAGDPGNLVAQEKCNEMKKAITAAERGAKFRDYLKKADANYEKGDIRFAFLYIAQALRLFPEGRDQVRERLAVMQREYSQELAALLEEKAVELKDIRAQIDSLLEKEAPSAAEAPPEAEPEPQPEPQPEPEASAEPRASGVPQRLQKIVAKAEKAARNEKGSWEAVFAGNITMVYIPEGEITIGSPPREGDADEHPAHKVFLDGYWIGKTEVTFEQYDRFCAETRREKPSDENWGRGTRPVIYVSWQDAVDFCAWLQGRTGLLFRLPSEAEWEKAARDRYPWGSRLPDSSLANFNKDHMMTRPVGAYPPGASPFGVLDLAGNVWEWTADWYDPGFYQVSPRENPRGPETGSERVVRGGSWANGASLVRSANRSSEKPESRLNILGFRLALGND